MITQQTLTKLLLLSLMLKHVYKTIVSVCKIRQCSDVNISFIGYVDPVNPRACRFIFCAVTLTTANSTVCVSFQSRILTSPRHPSIFPPPFCNWCWNDVINDVWKYPHATLHQQSEGLSDVLHTHLWAVLTSGKLAINLLPANTWIKEHNISPPHPAACNVRSHTPARPVVLKMFLLC